MFLIRPMEEKDLDAIAELEAENFSMPWKKDDFALLLRDSKALYLVGEDEDRIVCVGGVRNILGEGELGNISVKKEFQGQGRATVLLKQLLEQGRISGIRAFTLEVRRSNVAAVRLYEKLGFETEGIRKNFYQKPVEDALIMWKRTE